MSAPYVRVQKAVRIRSVRHCTENDGNGRRAPRAPPMSRARGEPLPHTRSRPSRRFFSALYSC